ncbi:response regulator transcription factor [Erysipelothrix sp. Poltava]|nr:response regulator transcription factor [Erysipelothrix sp. Poltava]
MLEEGNLRLNRRTNEVYKNGVLLDLTEREYRILRLLLGNPGRIYTMEQLFEIVWEDTYFYSCSNTVMVHICNLRKKVEDEPNKPKIVKNVWGKGYTYDGL